MKNAVLAVGCAALLLLLPGAAKADSIITFNVSGTATAADGQSCDLTCALSGTLTIDVTDGTVTAADITLPDLTAFDTDFEASSGPASEEYFTAENSSGDGLFLDVETTMMPGSLDGFDGGTIVGGATNNISSGYGLYSEITGSITPQTVSATPEPASWVLLGTGLLGMLGVMRRRVLPS